MLMANNTIDDVAEYFLVTRDAVSGWLASGELVGTNVNRSRDAKRPTWRISIEAVQAFERSRQNIKPSKPVRAKRSTKKLTATRSWI